MMVCNGFLKIRLATELTRDRGEIDETIGTQTQEGEAQGDPTGYTGFFAYRAGPQRPTESHVLHCEETALWKIADDVGTPAYVYSRASIKSAYSRLDKALGSLPHAVCYAVKANSNLAVLRLLAGLGSNFDIVSGGELDRLRRIGMLWRQDRFFGCGERPVKRLSSALAYSSSGTRAKAGRPGIRLFNVESEEELEVLLSEGERHARAREARRLPCPFGSIPTFWPAGTNTSPRRAPPP